MRPILPADLDAAARVLLGRPPALWPQAMAELLTGADLADRFRKRRGRLLPGHGDGSLLAEALRRDPPPLTTRRTSAYLVALSGVLSGIATWRARL